VGNALRLRALDGWLALHRLRAPRHADQGAAQSETDHGETDHTPAHRPLAPMYALTALTSHVRELEAGIGAGVLGALRAALQIVPLALALAWMAPGLAAVAGLVLVLFSLVLGRARRTWKRANERAARQREALLEAADEAVRHAELWTTYGAEPRVRAHLEGVGRALATQGARIEASAAALGGANEVLGALALVLAIVASRAGWLGTVGEAGVLLPFAVTFFLAYRPIRDLTDARLALARAGVAAEVMAPLLEHSSVESCESCVGEGASWPLAALEIESLRLARGLAGLACEISASIPAGTVLAIVGATGSGKTTLLRTLLGLEPAHGGTLRYGGMRLEARASGPRSRPFAWVPQDAPVLADTLDANITLAPGSTDPALALEAIGAATLAERVQGSVLGPAGRPLSGGERQWVSLARAVATRLPVLLLDEPTSGLDPAAQARVLQAIARLKGRRTVILVTHREEPLAIADAVLRLDVAAAPISGSRRASA
jgi:ABC-type transport system involved in cytochrome bd biosynthesis fused ATPase/permease subunit